TQALRGMSLEIPTGQFVTVIGSNGAGKSTFLNAVSGEQRVDSGTIEIDGIDMTRQPVWGRARHVARVFQDPLAGTCEDLTIEENMALAKMRGERRGFSFAVKPALREEFRAQLSTLGLGLENRLSDRIGLLSGGQRQAVSLLMAALQPSRLLLLDEHTAALDPRTAAFVLELTVRIVAEHKLTTMMESVVTEANPQLAIDGIKVAAKTGTAQIGTDNSAIDGWVIGFAPADDPKIA
ncbi:MAG: ATP-binding cassette domain-containing protein, partial [Thauera sp.]